MDPITRMVAAGAAGAAGGGNPTYVDDVFSTFVYNGNGSTQTINNGIDLSGEGGLVWIKNREKGGSPSAWAQNYLFDTERSPTISDGMKYLASNGNNGENNTGTDATKDFGGWTSNGFLLGEPWSVGADALNHSSGDDYVSWTFRKAPGFFDIVTYTGNGTNQSIAHNLGSVPGCLMIKNTSTSGPHWVVYHRGISVPAEKGLVLSEDWGEDDDVYFNDTAPTSTHFTVGPKTQTNTDGDNYVAYIFAHDDQSFGTNGDESIIKCGSYTTNSSGAIPDVNLGFEPQWLLIKKAYGQYGNTGNWYLYDHIRGMPVGGNNENLYPNLTNAAVTGANVVELTSTGFTSGPDYLASGTDTFIYVAIRRPHKPPTDATEVFAIDTSESAGQSIPPQFISGFATDVVIRKTMNGGNHTMGSRLQGIYYMQPGNSTQEDRVWPATALTWDHQNGWASSMGDPPNSNLFAYMFRRAPGFMDVVAYEGTGSTRILNHNLGAVPELVIVKNRENGSYGWATYTQALGRTKYLSFGDTGKESSASAGQMWGNSDFTSTEFSLGSWANTNHNGIDMIAYLFASLDGISKIGTYSGTGNNIDVNCGFSAGARFVMIKRTDTEISGTNGSHWYIWDTTNGIVSGNDPYWKASDFVAAVTNTDYIDPLNEGFTVTSSASANSGINASGGTYMFFAIA